MGDNHTIRWLANFYFIIDICKYQTSCFLSTNVSIKEKQQTSQKHSSAKKNNNCLPQDRCKLLSPEKTV